MHTLSFRSITVALGFLALVACDRPPNSAFAPRGGPESLLDVSSEVVNLNIALQTDRDQLKQWVRKDQPTRAELYCVAGDASCNAAQKLLDREGVPTMIVPSNNNTVTLVYERILAHDCNQRYIENYSMDVYNASYPSFGCATAANTVQHVSNKQQFVNPSLSDNPRAVSAVSAYQRSITPVNKTRANYDTSSSAVTSLSQ